MSITSKAATAYGLLIKAKKIRTYGKLILASIDENTRPGSLMKLGIRGMLEIGGKFLGRSLTSHPYFTYHKAHLEALSQALNATSNHEKAIEALNAAIRSADATGAIARSIGSYNTRREYLGLSYLTIDTGLEFLRDGKIDESELLMITEAGQTPDSFRKQLDIDLYEWRAKWCELYLDSLELLAMAQVEYRATDAAMQKFKAKLKAMASGGSLGTVAALQTEKDKLWLEYDRAVHPQAGVSEKAISDPTGYAADQVRSIQKLTDQLGVGCEEAMAGVIN